MNFKLLSPRGNECEAEGQGIRERKLSEKVHFRVDDGLECAVCGQFFDGLIWTDREHIFDAHPLRCGNREGKV